MRRKHTSVTKSAQAAKARTLVTVSLLAMTVFALCVAASVAPSAHAAEQSAVPTASVSATRPAGAISVPASGSAGLASELTSLTPAGEIGLQIADTSTPAPSSGSSLVVTLRAGQPSAVAPGNSIAYAFDVANESSAADVFDLAASDESGFATHLRDALGAEVASLPLAAGESTRVVIAIDVPDTATVGASDATTLSATSETTPDITGQAAAFTSIHDALEFSADSSTSVSPGTQASFRHTIANNLPTTETVALSALDEHDWPVAFYATDGVTEITSVTVPPYGGTADVIAALLVPADAPRGVEDTLTVAATGASTTVDVFDTTTVRRLDTYASATDSTPTSDFRLGDTVWARAGGVTPDASVCFVWVAPSGSIARISATSTVDASGTAADAYSISATDTVGTWQVELHADAPDGPLIETRAFDVTYRGQIISLSATDGRNTNAVIGIASATHNESSLEITGSVVTYLVWWDANNDGVFDAADTYIDASGSPHPYSADATTHVSALPSLEPSGTWVEPAPWTITNTNFPNQGTYNVTAVWRSSLGATIDRRTAQFYAVPTLGWPPFLLLVGTIGVVLWRRGPWMTDSDALAEKSAPGTDV